MSLNRLPHAVAFGAALLAAPLSAAPIYQSATYTGVDTGEYILSSYDVIGGVFTLTGVTNVSAIGAQFGGYPNADIFGAILPVDPATGLPVGSSQDLGATALGHVVFSVTGGTHDQSAALPLTLGAGTYAVVFGSGQFGATGWAGLGCRMIRSGTLRWFGPSSRTTGTRSAIPAFASSWKARRQPCPNPQPGR